MAQTVDERAGKRLPDAELADVPALLTAYHAGKPDPQEPTQRVAFGTSGHRGSSLKTSFNEAHLLAIAQATCDYRAEQGTSGPLFLGVDTHALSAPALVSVLEVLVANGVEVVVDSRDGYTPTPAVSHAILTHNRGGGRRDGRRGGDQPVAQPAGGRRHQVQPAARRPGRLRRHRLDPGPGQRADRRGPGRGASASPYAKALAADNLHRHDYLDAYVGDLPAVVDLEAIRGVRAAAGRGPARRRGRRLLAADRRAARPGPDRGQRRRRPDVPVHDRRPRRQDPDGLLLALRHGVA